MINNLAKVIIAENGSIKDFEDTAFLVSNADEVNSIQMYVPDSIGSSLVQLSLKEQMVLLFQIDKWTLFQF